MKKVILLLFMVFLNQNFAQVMGPKISFSEMEYDFGEIEEGVKVSHDFKVFNTGDDLLKIERVRASCGCTAAMPEKSELAPGESTVIKVTFNSDRRSGVQKKYVYVTSNDKEKKQVRLIFKANIKVNKSPASSSGAKLFLKKKQHNFGSVKEGDVLHLNIPFVNNGTNVLQIKDVKSSCGCTAALISKKVLQPNENGQIQIDLETEGYQGRLTRTVTIQSNDYKNPTQTVALFVNVERE